MSNEEQGILQVKCKIFLQINMQSFLYENITNTLQANLMQAPCKMQQCIMMQKENVFVFFELYGIQRKSMTLQPLDSASTTRQHPSKASR